ncbi:unnamed protein product [Didymodactylos carnosus]|uniref:N-acetyltransferase domain-containing protein n=1 Tax=Didymodactylos carnosus TaxID=1234261 RepID=A0A814XW18_9BILA|nr:unnamed protein product [Didymodactylos carnosus]CAF3984445.1 unnamed protein product [Didymodactylos carnosus]
MVTFPSLSKATEHVMFSSLTVLSHECQQDVENENNYNGITDHFSFWLYRDSKIETLNVVVRPMFWKEIFDLKLIFLECSYFKRAIIDFSIYYSFKPKHHYIMASKQNILAHASITRWNEQYALLGVVFVRKDYRKFGLGELLTNYVLEMIEQKCVRSIHANCLTEHLPFYIRYGFKASFSIVGLSGKLNEFLHMDPFKYQTSAPQIDQEQIIIELFETSDILDLASYDRNMYPTYRINYFEQLREHTISIAGYVAKSAKTGTIYGYVILNFSQDYIKCGPLYCDNDYIAMLLLKQCAIDYDGIMLLCIPEDNRTALKCFESKSFKRTDILHRVYTGNMFETNFQKIWAITDDWFCLL